MSKIAFASSDGLLIDRHFGRAEHFYIYEIDEEGHIALEGSRAAPPLSEEGDHERLDDIVELLADVSYVLCAQIGQNAVRTLQARGISGFALKGEVQKVLQNYVKRRPLIKNLADCAGPDLPACGPGGCR